MKKVLYVAKDTNNPPDSGFEEAQRWAERNKIENYYISSHRLGTKTDTYQNQVEVFAYEVCVDTEEQ